jgi:hypothetical protein
VARSTGIGDNRYKNNKRLVDENQQHADLDNFNEWQDVINVDSYID